jgi:hypothetical protein
VNRPETSSEKWLEIDFAKSKRACAAPMNSERDLATAGPTSKRAPPAPVSQPASIESTPNSGNLDVQGMPGIAVHDSPPPNT